MKKKILLFIILIMLPLFVYACDDDEDIEITAVTISGETRVQIGTTEASVATIIPNTALNQNVTWSVINITGEATINSSGVLTPVSEGTVRVVATAVNGVEGVRNVTVISARVPVETVTITGPSSVALNHTANYIAQVAPLDATDPQVEWTIIPQTGSAEITQTGILTPLSEGTITIVAIADGVPAEKEVIINPAIIPLSDIEILAPEEIFEFEEHQMLFEVTPNDATYQNVSWTVINDTGRAVISPAGFITALSPGVVIVKITIDDMVRELSFTIKDLPNLVQDFVFAQDGYFFEGDQEEPFRFLGTNNYTLHYKSEAMIDDAIKQAADMGIRVIRMWSFFDGWEDEGRANYAYGQIAPGVYDVSPTDYFGEILYDRNTGERKDPVNVLDRVDYTIKRAGQYGIRVVLVLTNYYPEFGGMNAYVNWHNTLYGTSLTRQAFYTNETIKGWYKDWVSHVVNRTNKLTGVAYKDDPTIFSWQLANEPDGGQAHVWAAEMSAFLKNDLQVNQMVSVGAQGSLGNAPSTLTINKDTAEGRIAEDDDFNYQFTRQGIGGNHYGYGTSVNHWALMQIETVDYSTAHLYPDHWGISPNYAIEYGEKFIKDHVAIAKYWGKPFVLEEYGVMRASHDESRQIHRDLTYDVWNRALFEMGGAGSMFWILTGLEDSPDADADGNYPDFDGFRILNDNSSTAHLFRQYAKLFKGEINHIEREDRVYMLSPLRSLITNASTFKVEVKVVTEEKEVDKVYLYVHGQLPIEMTPRPSDPYRQGIYDTTLDMRLIEPGEQYTIKTVVMFTDGTQIETVARNIRRYIYLELDTLYTMDFNENQTINFQTFGSYEAQLRSIHHNKDLEMLEMNVLNSGGNWAEHKVKLIAFPPTSSGLAMIPNTFRLSYTTYYNKEIVDALGGSPVLKNYIALEPGWIKTGIDANNVSISAIRTNALKEDTDPTKRADIGVRWIDLNDDGIQTSNEMFYFHVLTIEFVPNDTLNAIAINPTTGGMAYDGIMYIDDVILYGYQDGAPIDSLEPDPNFEFDVSGSE
jgi:mannan endo-1,4-beta-mannosidase